MFSISGSSKAGQLQYSNNIPVLELIDKLKNNTAQEDKSTLAIIWSTIKEFFCGSNKKKVCDVFFTLFDKNSNQEYRIEALFKLMSYFEKDTAEESKQPLAWHLTPDDRPRFSVSMTFSGGTFYSQQWHSAS